MNQENKVILSVEVKSDGAEKGLKDIDKGLKSTTESAKKTKKEVAGLNDSLDNLPNHAGDAAQGVKGLLVQMKALVANPIGLAITAVATAMGLLYKSLSVLNPVLHTFEDVMGGLSETANALFTNIGNFVTGQKDANRSLSEAYNYGVKATQAMRDYEDSMKDLNLQNVIYDRQIDLLMRKSKNRAISDKERNELLKEAMRLQEEQIKHNREVAQQEGKALAFRIKAQGGSFAQMEQVQKGASVAAMNIQSKSLEDLLFQYQEYVAKRIKTETGYELQRERIKNATDANELKTEKTKQEKKLTADEELQKEAAKKFEDWGRQKRELEFNQRVEDDIEREARSWRIIEDEKAIEEQITQNKIDEGKKRQEIYQTEADNRIATIGAIGDAMAGFSMLAEEQSEEAKMLASANALINTYLAANQVLADKTLPTVAKAFAVAGIVAAGLANVKKINSIDARGGGGVSQAPSAVPPIVRPTSTFTTLDNTKPIITNPQGGKTKVYVTETDITAAQDKVNSIKVKATL